MPNKIHTAFGSLAAPTASATPPGGLVLQHVATPHASEGLARALSLPLAEEPTPWIAAHRGQWRDFPENSIPAILTSIEDGAHIVDIDIKRISDGELVLVHDDTVARTTTGTGHVADLTLEKIKSLHLREGQGNGPAPATEYKVVTFTEALEAVRGQNVLLNLDKGWEYREQLCAELAAANMVASALFKGAPLVDEAVDFMDTYPDAQYMHIINDDQTDNVEAITAWRDGEDVTRYAMNVELVIHTQADPDTAHGTVTRIANELGVSKEALRVWGRKHKAWIQVVNATVLRSAQPGYETPAFSGADCSACLPPHPDQPDCNPSSRSSSGSTDALTG